MRIVMIEPVSLIDFPGKIASVVFLEGCSMCCSYCYNYPLLTPEEGRVYITVEEMFAQLEENSRLVDGVVFTGGEPTINEDLVDVFKSLYNDGYYIKLDTNGTRTDMINRCLPYIDYIAMDLKSNKAGYSELGASAIDVQNVSRSIKTIMKSRKEYEFRCTAIYPFVNDRSIHDMGRWIAGAKRFVLQRGRLDSVLCPSAKMSAHGDDKLEEYAKIMRGYVRDVTIR